MMPLRAPLVVGLLCAVCATAWLQPAVAADGSDQQAQGNHDASATPTSAEAGAESDVAPSATLELASEQMRLIMGGTKGKGVLHFAGADHPFTFKTASAGLGGKAVTSVSATGEVYGLKQASDFAGKYTAVSRGALAGTSETTATYKSDKGVEVKLRATVKGVGLSLGGGIATIELVKK